MDSATSYFYSKKDSRDEIRGSFIFIGSSAALISMEDASAPKMGESRKTPIINNRVYISTFNNLRPNFLNIHLYECMKVFKKRGVKNLIKSLINLLALYSRCQKIGCTTIGRYNIKFNLYGIIRTHVDCKIICRVHCLHKLEKIIHRIHALNWLIAG